MGSQWVPSSVLEVEIAVFCGGVSIVLSVFIYACAKDQFQRKSASHLGLGFPQALPSPLLGSSLFRGGLGLHSMAEGVSL